MGSEVSVVPELSGCSDFSSLKLRFTERMMGFVTRLKKEKKAQQFLQAAFLKNSVYVLTSGFTANGEAGRSL